jgi:hypothetical protein
VQAGPHRAFTQASPLPQARPQTPQFFLSVKTFTQELPQGISPEEHDNSGVIVVMGTVVLATVAEVPGRIHRPFWQLCPDGQMFPHDPQFPASFWRSLQVPLQELRPDGHDPGITAAVGDVVPDSAGDDPVLFRAKDPLNCPFMQVSPKGTEKPHAPQLSWSVLRSTHFPLQRDRPSEHWPIAGMIPEPWDTPLLFFIPADNGEPESAKNATAAIMRIIPINPSTSTGDRIAVFGRGSDCAGSAGGDK